MVGKFDCTHLRVQLKVEQKQLKRKVDFPPETNTAGFGISQVFLDTLCDSCSCPITLLLYNDPVIASDGYTYERKALLEHFATNGQTSPMTNAPMPRAVVPNRAIRQLVESARVNVKRLCE